MKRFYLFMFVLFVHGKAESQSTPCGSDPVYRQFDFWLGNWEAFGPKGQKAGDSKISLILDSCIVLEEWTSASLQKNLRFQGKSFNTYNAQTKQWQQTWVDNTGNTTHYLKGRAETNRLIRIKEIPEVEVSFVDNGIDPTGLGEPALPPTGGAVANAIFKASGIRLRNQPFNEELNKAVKPSSENYKGRHSGHGTDWKNPP